MVRQVAEHNPELARAALAGLAAYERAPRSTFRASAPEVARVGEAILRDHGGDGPPAVLIPSLINPPRVLDLDQDVSLCAAVSGMGRRSLLLDWGPAETRASLNVSGHIEQLMLPLLRRLGEPPALVGYCLGGTMALAAANCLPCERVVTIAAPWRFVAYPDDARTSLAAIWASAKPAAQRMGVLPMEVLQSAFWSLDPDRTVRKFATFASLRPGSAEAARFVAIEDWANEGEALPYAAAAELIEELFGRDAAGRGTWEIDGCRITTDISAPVLHLLASRDRIAPAATAAPGPSVQFDAGHVGMIVGRARAQLHQELEAFLTA